MDKEVIIAKLKDDLELTREEELFYLTEIVGHTTEEAETIITIAENKDKNLLID